MILQSHAYQDKGASATSVCRHLYQLCLKLATETPKLSVDITLTAADLLLQAKFGYRLDDPKWAPDWLPNEQLEMLHSDIDARQIIDGEFDQLLQDLKVCELPCKSSVLAALDSCIW